MTKRLLFLSILFVSFSLTGKAGWGDFMKSAAAKIGSSARTVGTTVGSAATRAGTSVGRSVAARASCNRMRNQGMANTPQYNQECIQTGLGSSGMGGGQGIPYGVMPLAGASGSIENSTLNQPWSDDPLAGAASQFMQQGGMGQNMMGGGMMGQSGYGMPQQATGFSGAVGRSLVNNLMGGNRGMSQGGGYYGANSGYGSQSGYGANSGYGPQPGQGMRPY